MLRHKRLVCILLVLVLASALIPTVLAYMVHKSQTVSNVFKPAVVSCEVKETFDAPVKSEISIKNTGNIDAYIRVRLVPRWEDSKGNPVARDMDFPGISYDNSKWYQVDAYTYCYRTPVAPKESTSDLLASDITMYAVQEKDRIQGTTQEVIYDYYPVVEVLAEAIQSKPASVVTDSWGVTLNGEGMITNGT